MRKLAEETASAVNKIQSLVLTVQTLGGTAKQPVVNSNTAITVGKNQIESASKMFNLIEAMHDLSAQLLATQQAVNNLQQSKLEAVASVEEITQITQKESDSIEQVFETTEQKNASMEQIVYCSRPFDFTSSRASNICETI